MSIKERYVRLCNSFYDKGILVKEKDVHDKVSSDKEWYQSTYYYDQNHYNQFQKTGSIKGIRDVSTNKLWFDFDSEHDPSIAQKDAIQVVDRLNKHGIDDKNIEVYFSGNKGFHINVTLNRELKPKQVANICSSIGRELDTLDNSLYDAAQILRIPGTKNTKTGLFKVPLTVKQLKKLNINEIKAIAQSLDNVSENFEWSPVDVNDSLIEEQPKEEVIEIEVKTDLKDILAIKPREWKDYKWALLNAYKVKPDERHESLLRIVATCRGLGYPLEYARAMCLVFDDKFVAQTGKDPVADLDTNILPSVYSEGWNGGQFSYKNDIWLQKYCERIGIRPEDSLLQESTITIDEAFGLFKDYAENIDDLTIKTGIDALDERLRLTIGMTVSIVAGPGTGKTTLALKILNTMSRNEEQSLFLSYDMFHALVFQKLVQKHMNITEDTLFSKFKNNDSKFIDNSLKVLKEEYKNVEFCFKSGQSIDDIERTIRETEEKTGKKIRLVVLDYNELVITDVGDMTQSSAFVAQNLRRLANTLNVCIVTLVQPSKMTGSPSDEILSYRAIKGSSSIEQASSIILGMWRPGYDPRYPQDDNYITINCLKNRMGGLFTLDLGFSGANSDVYELTDEQHDHLKSIRARKNEEKSEDKKWD